jgi:hypothetical protein
MTAMGAGTVLSTLHAFGRAVLLLHGHKHVPTARLISGMTAHCGDVLIASAGSAGTRERVHAARHPDAARLWPSFNVAEVSESKVRIEAVAFAPKSSTRPPLRRELAHAHFEGPKWRHEWVSFRVKDPAPRVDVDEARYTLHEGRPGTWSYACERRIEVHPGARLQHYVDFAHTIPRVLGKRGLLRHGRRVELVLNGTTRYEQPDALCRTLDEARHARGADEAFEWVGLLCRYGATKATLRLARSYDGPSRPFGSITDLTIGRERPVALSETDTEWVLHAESPAPRTLLRIYWALD